MILLTSSQRSLKLVLDSAVNSTQLPIILHFKKYRAFEGDMGFGCQITNSNSTTEVTIGTAPSSGNTHDISSISIYNADDAAATVTVTYDENGTGYTIFRAALDAGDQAYYETDAGWQVLTSAGALK